MADDNSRKVLVVEDNDFDVERLERLLRNRRRRYEIVRAATIADALALLRKPDAEFDCVILDNRLPDGDGPAFLRALRGSGTRLPFPVTMLTAEEDDAVAATTLELGADDYLLKDAMTAEGLTRSIENVREKFEIRKQLELQRAAVDLRNQRLESMREQLESRLEELTAATQARDRFIAMMSHEMRTPLNAILGYAELLELEIEGSINAAQRRNLDRIRVGSRHLLNLINDVLDLARADARKLELDMTPIDLNAASEEVVALLENEAAQKSIELIHVTDPSAPLASADLQRVRQILMNLIGNAIKFTEKGQVTVTVKQTGNEIAVSVKDTGIGIEQQMLAEVFDEFVQVDNDFTRPYGGSGLGLAIARRLARAMDGDIEVESTIGKGSTFTFTLPVPDQDVIEKADDASGDGRSSGVEPHRSHRRESIPVVAFGHSQPSLAALAEQVSPAVRMVWTTSEHDVAEIAAREKASLIILDVSSSDGAAWKAAQRISEAAGDRIPAILLLPGFTVSEQAPGMSAVDLGLIALVPKPFTSEQLTKAVSTAAGHPDDDSSRESYDVLVIDDDADSRRVAGKFLGDFGMSVREAVDGESGLVEMRLKAPDVVVLDLMMPVLDGFGVMATMRADPFLSAIPIVVLTAKTLTDAERKFVSRSAVRVLQKGEHRLSDVAALVLRAAARSKANLATNQQAAASSE